LSVLRFGHIIAESMALTKKDIGIISGIMEDGFEKFAHVVAKGFAGVDKRFDDVDKKFVKIDGRLDGIDIRLDGIDVRLDSIDTHIEHIDARLDTIEHDVAEIKDDRVTRHEFAQLDTRVAVLEKKDKAHSR